MRQAFCAVLLACFLMFLAGYRLGASEGMISQIVEIGSNQYPYGFVWLYCGVALADKNPVYQYELRLSFVP